MAVITLDGEHLARMILYGAKHLENNAQMVDALNVFPVPDGDTGTNMNLSMTSGAKEVKENFSKHIGKVGIALSKGLLMGARGNSGVILSQLFRGFSKFIETKSEITSIEFADALQHGVQTAYRAVMKPVEGTILTVAKDAAKRGVIFAKNEIDICLVMEEIVKEARASLKRTPDLLPVLKEVGVVDSGGQGLLCVYEGFLAELKGEQIGNEVIQLSMTELVSTEHHRSVQSFMSTEDIEFGYCTEFMVRFEEGKRPFVEEIFRNELSNWGDSLLVIADDELVKVHIHVEQPGDCLTYGQQYGSLINMKIENMRQQHTKILEKEQPVSLPKAKKAEKQAYGIVTVALGSGISELFESLGAKKVIEGGQTMNPSTEDIVTAINDVHAETVFVLPNNKNIVMTANQAVSLADTNVIVIPTKTIPQGMAALLAFNPLEQAATNEDNMKEAIGNVKTGQVTFAVRDTQIQEVEITKGDYMGIVEGDIIVAETDRIDVAKKLLTNLLKDGADILTILYGEDVYEEEVQEITDFVEAEFPRLEVEIHNGGQPLYPFIFAVE